MNVLVVHNYYKIPGGEDTVVANEKRLLEEYGNSVFLYTRSNEELDKYNGAKKIILPFKILFSLKTFKEIRKIIEREKIDIVHVHNTVCVVSPSVYYAAFSKKIPVVQTIHNFRLLCTGATFFREGKICEECVEKGIFHACKYACYRGSKISTFASAFVIKVNKLLGTYKKLNYICLTEFNKQKLLQMNRLGKDYIDPNRVYIKPNFTDEFSEIKTWKERKNQVVYAGRLDETKGIKKLFEAWKSIFGIELVVCGTGPEEEWCKAYIENNHIGNIKMLGYVPHDKTMMIIAESKALILLTQWYEGFPMVLAESFGCGTPVIGSKMGNVGSIIVDYVNGKKVNHDSLEEIITAVNSLSDMVESTYKCSQELYSKGKNYEKLLEIYKTVLE